MSYFDIGSTELISRRSYGGVGEYLATGLSFSDVTGAIKDVGANVLNFYGQQQQQAGAAAAYAQMAQQQRAASGMPSWLLPVLLVGGGLILLKTMRK